MNRAATLKEILRKLDREARSVAVEAAYLVIRCLSHRLTVDRLRSQAEAEAKLPHQRQAIDLAVRIVEAIAEAEGAEVADLPESVRRAYEQPLAQAVLMGGDKRLVDRAKVDAALRELSGAA